MSGLCVLINHNSLPKSEFCCFCCCCYCLNVWLLFIVAVCLRGCCLFVVGCGCCFVCVFVVCVLLFCLFGDAFASSSSSSFFSSFFFFVVVVVVLVLVLVLVVLVLVLVLFAFFSEGGPKKTISEVSSKCHLAIIRRSELKGPLSYS